MTSLDVGLVALVLLGAIAHLCWTSFGQGPAGSTRHPKRKRDDDCCG